MNRKAFFRSLILGGIIVPRVPKLILTGGWLPNSVSFTVSGLDKGEFVGHFSGSPIIGVGGYAFIDIEAENCAFSSTEYYTAWDKSDPSLEELYNRIKAITRDES